MVRDLVDESIRLVKMRKRKEVRLRTKNHDFILNVMSLC